MATGTEVGMAAETDTATSNDVVLTSLSFVIYLRGTPRQVRAVLTDPALVPRWLAGTQFHPAAEIDPRRLSCEWLQTDHFAANGGSASVVRFEFVAMGQVTRRQRGHTAGIGGGPLREGIIKVIE